jgi:hypothetical protein
MWRRSGDGNCVAKASWWQRGGCNRSDGSGMTGGEEAAARWRGVTKVP